MPDRPSYPQATRTRSVWPVVAMVAIAGAIALLLMILLIPDSASPPEALTDITPPRTQRVPKADLSKPGVNVTPSTPSDANASGLRGGSSNSKRDSDVPGNAAGRGESTVGDGSGGTGNGSRDAGGSTTHPEKSGVLQDSKNGSGVSSEPIGGPSGTGGDSGSPPAGAGKPAAKSGGAPVGVIEDVPNGKALRTPPLEDYAAGKIYFEGRWIEDAIKQKSGERLARRAYKEVEAHMQSKYGEATRISNFDDLATIVATADSPHTLEVVGRLTRPGKEPEDFVLEVRRSTDGKWAVRE